MPTFDDPTSSLVRRATTAITVVILALSTAAPSRAASPENAMPDSSEMEERCRKEVLGLHQFFQDWFNAELEPTDEEFDRFVGVMAEGFTIVSPDGEVSERQPLIDDLRGAHGRWQDQPGRIWIKNIVLRRLAGEMAVVTYEEWQESANGTRGRLSTALFKPREGAPNGVAWLHVHETWLPARD